MGGVGYRVRRLLVAQWRPMVLLVLIVGVVGGIVLTLVAGTVRTATAPDRYETAQGLRYDTSLEQEFGPPLTEEIEALPSVASVAATTFFFGALVPAGDRSPVDAIAFVGDPEALGTELIDGRPPAGDEPGEFVATGKWTEVAGAEIGDRFELLTVSQEAAAAAGFDGEPDGPTLEATLVGVIGGAVELQDEFPVALFPIRLLDEGPIGLASTQALVSLEDGADLADLRAQLDGLSDGDLVSLMPVDLVPLDFRRAVATQANALVVIALVLAVAGLVLCAQVAVRLVRQSDDQRLALSALGLTQGQVLGEATARVAVPAVLGGFVAVVAAALASGLFPRGFVGRVEPDPGIRLEPVVHLPGLVLLALGLVVTVGAVLAGSDRTRRTHRPTAADRWAARVGEARTAMALRFAFARHGRDAGSLSTPITGLVVLVAVLVAAGTFGAALDDLVEDDRRHGTTFDLATGQGGRERVAEEAQAATLADPDVIGLTLLGNTSVSVGERGIAVTGHEAVLGDFDVTVLDGRRPAGADEIGLGRRTATDLGLGVGDEFVAETSAGERRLQVTGLVVVPGIEGGEGLGEGGLVTADGFAALEPEGALSAMGIVLRKDAETDAVAERLSVDTGLAVGSPDPPGVIRNLSRVQSAPYLVVGLLGILVLVSLVNLMVLTLDRRGNDVALLRSLGADRAWMARVEHGHAAAVVVVLAALSIPFGIVAGRVVFRALAHQIGSSADTAVPWPALLGGIVVGFVVLDGVAQVVVRRRRGSLARRLASE